MNIYKTFNCLRCGAEATRDKRFKPNVCVECAVEHRVEGCKATAIVSKSVRLGFIAKASLYKCVDCGEQAANYDHRDYTKPLAIEPVCKSCNGIRGYALDSKLRVFATQQNKAKAEALLRGQE